MLTPSQKALLYVYRKEYPDEYSYRELEYHSFARSNQAMRLVMYKLTRENAVLPSAELLRGARQYVERERAGNFSPACKELREAILACDAGCVDAKTAHAVAAAQMAASPASSAERTDAAVAVAASHTASTNVEMQDASPAASALLSAVDDDAATISAPSTPTVTPARVRAIQAGIRDEKRVEYLRDYYDQKNGRYPVWVQSRMSIANLVVDDDEQEALDAAREEAERRRGYRYGRL